MSEWARNIIWRLLHSLSFKLSLSVGLIIFLAVALGAYFEVQRQHRQSQRLMREQAEGFVETVRRATYWSMLRNQRQSLHRIIRDVASQPGVIRIRVFNKEGTIMFSSADQEIGTEVDKKAEACFGCHAQDKPLTRLPISERSRIFRNRRGTRVLGTILPIYNEPACSSAPCHAHPPERKVLGVLDVDLSLAELDRNLQDELWRTLAFALALFLGVSTLIGLAIIATVNRSVNRLVTEVDKVAAGDLDRVEAVQAPDELGQIARAFNRMAQSVARRAHLKERRYRQLVHNSTDAVILMDRQGRIIMANPEAGAILGRESGELEGQDAAALVHPQDLPVLKQALEQALADQGPTELVSFRVQGPGGQTRVLEGRFRRLEGTQGLEGGLLANLRDITERRALEAELSRRRDFERKLIQQALNAIIATDEKGIIQVFNHSAEELLEIEASEVVGKLEYTRFFPRAQIRVLGRTLFDNPRDGASLVRPAVVATSGGKRLPVMLSARVMFMQGHFSGVMFFLQNLRESKALKAQLLRKTRLAAVGQTAAGLAHCMKNLLHGLGTAIYLVDQGLEENDLELARQGWGMVRKNMNQLEELTQDLLAYAKDRRPEYQLFNLNQTLYECVSFVMGRAREKGVALEVAPDPSCDRVMLDPLGMRRILLNLLSNALDALEESPPSDETPTITIKSGRDGYGQVWVSVTDNGPGLPGEVKRHLFTRIFSSKGSKGTGLGLLVCQKIAEEHGGAIECTNLPGRGVRFTISVPDLSEPKE